MDMGNSGFAAMRHVAFAMEACQTPCHSVGLKSSRILLAATYWVRSGRAQVAGAAWSETLLVCTRRSQSLAKVPRFRAGVHADCMLWAVHGPTYSVSDFWWGLGPTAWNAVGSTLHLQQPDCQAAALQMVPRASEFALWSLCYVPHTSLFSSCIRLHDPDYCFGMTNDSKYNVSLSLRKGCVLYFEKITSHLSHFTSHSGGLSCRSS